MILVPVGPNQNEAELADVVGESMRWRTPMVQKVGEMLLIGTQGTQDQLRDLKPAERPELEAAFKLAGNSAAQVFLVPSDDFRRKMTTEPAALEQFGAERAKVLADGVQWAVLTADAPLLASWKLTIQSKDAASAKQLQSLIGVAVPQGLGMAVQMASMFAPQAAQFMPNPAELAKAAIPKVTGDRLTLTVDEKNTLVALAMKLLKQVGPGVGRARDTARRTESSNNLKRLGLAFHTTYDVSKEFARGYRGADKKPLLSWRVQLLPAVDEAGLFKEFHLDEPWDSPHNKTLIERMPLVYRSPNMKTDKKGLTTYLVPSGDKTILSGDAPVGIIDVTDGSSNTILVVDVSDENAVIWTKPDDWQYDAEKPMQGLIGHYPDGFQALLVDGSVKFISKDVDVETLKALMTRNAGDKVGAY